MKITYVKGNCLNPQSNKVVIAHLVNCAGKFNAGIARQIRAMYPKVVWHYLEYVKTWKGQVLGDCLLSDSGLIDHVGGTEVWIAHLFGMRDVYNSSTNPKPLCLESLITAIEQMDVQVNVSGGRHLQMPRIGGGLARGDEHWPAIERALTKLKSFKTVTVFNY